MDGKWQQAATPGPVVVILCSGQYQGLSVTPLHAAPVKRGRQFLKETPKHKAKFRYKGPLCDSLPGVGR